MIVEMRMYSRSRGEILILWYNITDKKYGMVVIHQYICRFCSSHGEHAERPPPPPVTIVSLAE